MRITNGMILSNYMDNLNKNLARMDKYQKQIATNKRITKLSDDPVGAISTMRCRVKLYRIEQYKKNIDNAQTWLKQTETSVLEMNEVIKSAYETCVHVANDYMSSAEKNAAAELIGQLRDHALMIGNSKSGDKYVFAGHNTGNPPFTLDGSGNILYNGLNLENDTNPDLIAEDNKSIVYEIGYHMNMQVTLPGTKLMDMGENNIHSVLDDLYTAMKGDASAEQLSGYIDKLQGCQNHLMAVEAEIGGKVNRLELVANRYDEDFINYTELKSSIEDVDLAEATMLYTMAESVYMAALRIGANIIQPSLADFLD